MMIGPRTFAGPLELDLSSVVSPGQFAGSLESRMNLSHGVRAEIGVGFRGHLESPDDYETQVQTLAVTKCFGRRLTLTVGKRDYHLGRGRLGALLSPGEGVGYPSLAYRTKLGRATYTKVLGDLTVDGGPYRRLGLHYLRYNATRKLSIGIGEAFVRTAPFPGDFFYDTLPILPYYLVKYLPGIHTNTDNNIVYLDGQLRRDGWTAYGEFMVNEFPVVPGVSTNPALYGLLVGAAWSDWTAEYTRLSNSAYSNGNSDTVYSYRGRGLGHPLESDGDLVQVQWQRSVTPQFNLTLGGFLRRKGEGKIDTWYNTRQQRIDNAFLSGVVETTVAGLAKAEYDFGDWSLLGEVKAGPVVNQGHMVGDRGVYYELRYGVSYRR